LAEIQKIYVDAENNATLLCPHCGTSKTVNVENLKSRGDPLKIRCTCKEAFAVTFEFRKAHRKETNLAGHFCKLPASEDWHSMTVKNISSTGIGFETYNPHGLGKGDEVRVRFALDDAKRSTIERDVIVRVVKDRYIGCEFSDPSVYDKTLGFYLMP
jgi:hypothetical protein